MGEPEPEMLKQVAATTPFMPQDKPRYTMGLGTPPQLLKMVALGVDMFDCVLPSRVARNGLVFTPDGPLNLRNEKFRTDPKPIVGSGEGAANYAARFSRAAPSASGLSSTPSAVAVRARPPHQPKKKRKPNREVRWS